MTAILSRLISRPRAFALGAILLLALVLRLPALDYCMGPDEAYTFTNNIIRGLRPIVFGPYLAGNHMLTSLCVWTMLNIFGSQDWAFQLPILLMGLGTVLVAYPIGALLFNNKNAGLAASFFFAWTPYHVAYSTNARGYVPMMLFILLSAALIYLNLVRATAPRLVALALVTCLMGISHMSSLIMFSAWGVVLGACAIRWTIVREDRRRVLSVILTGLALLAGLTLVHIAYSPEFLLYHGLIGRAVHGTWPDDIAGFLAGAEAKQWHEFWRYTDANVGVHGNHFLIGCAVAIGGLVLSVRRRAYGSLICLAGIVAPLTVMVVVGLVIEPRYTIFLLPFCVLALGAGTAICAEAIGKGSTVFWKKLGLGRRLMLMRCAVSATAFVLLTLFFAVGTVPLYMQRFPYYGPQLACVSNDNKSAARYIGSRVTANDLVSYFRPGRYPTEHYAERYIYPEIDASQWPPDQFKIWMISPDSAMPALAYNWTKERQFWGAHIWSAPVTSAHFKRMDLPPLRLGTGPTLLQLLVPWCSDIQPNLVCFDATVAENAADCADPTLFVTGTMCESYLGVFSPLLPCPPDSVVFIRGEIRVEDTSHRSVGLALRFFDDQENRLHGMEWEIREPSKQPDTLQPPWKLFQLGVLTPPETALVSAGLEVETPVPIGEAIGFRTIEVWVNAGPQSASTREPIQPQQDANTDSATTQ